MIFLVVVVNRMIPLNDFSVPTVIHSGCGDFVGSSILRYEITSRMIQVHSQIPISRIKFGSRYFFTDFAYTWDSTVIPILRNGDKIMDDEYLNKFVGDPTTKPLDQFFSILGEIPTVGAPVDLETSVLQAALRHLADSVNKDCVSRNVSHCASMIFVRIHVLSFLVLLRNIEPLYFRALCLEYATPDTDADSIHELVDTIYEYKPITNRVNATLQKFDLLNVFHPTSDIDLQFTPPTTFFEG